MVYMGNFLFKLRNSKVLLIVKLKRGSGSVNWELKEFIVYVFIERLLMNVIVLICLRFWIVGFGLYCIKKILF